MKQFFRLNPYKNTIYEQYNNLKLNLITSSSGLIYVEILY